MAKTRSETTRNARPMTMKEFEKSSADKKADKKELAKINAAATVKKSPKR